MRSSPPWLPPCTWSVVDLGGDWIAVQIFLVHFGFNSSGPPNSISMITMKLNATKWFVFAYLPFLDDSFLGKIFDGGSVAEPSNLLLHLELFQMAAHPVSPHSLFNSILSVWLNWECFLELPSLHFWVNLGHKKHFAQGLRDGREPAAVLHSGAQQGH